jgi:hypothetical protein
MSKKGKVYYLGKYRNLSVWINRDGTYSIKGSIWKFAKGNNYGSFSLEECKDAFDELNSLTMGTFLKANVVGYEFGYNFRTAQPPKVYINQLSHSVVSRRTVSLHPSRTRSSQDPWGVHSSGFYQYYKIYSKMVESGLDYNLMRVEHVVKNVICGLRQRMTAKDLLLTTTIRKERQILDSFMNNIAFRSEFDPTFAKALSMQNKWRYLALCKSQLSLKELFNLFGCSEDQSYRERKACKKILEVSHVSNPLKKELLRGFYFNRV